MDDGEGLEHWKVLFDCNFTKNIFGYKNYLDRAAKTALTAHTGSLEYVQQVIFQAKFIWDPSTGKKNA